MSVSHKAGLALAVLGALASATGAHALGITLTPKPVTGGGPLPYTYAYTVTPTTFNATQFAFSFSDPNVTFGSVTGPLNVVSQTTPGSFINFSSTGAALAVNTTETITFTSPDASTGGTFVAAGTGTPSSINGAAAGSSPVVAGPGPAPVPEVSTTASLGLLLLLGLGGVVVAARKKKVA